MGRTTIYNLLHANTLQHITYKNIYTKTFQGQI